MTIKGVKTVSPGDDDTLIYEPKVANAVLIAECAQLGYLRSDWHTLDPTFGQGKWWKNWAPDQLIARDVLTHPDWDYRIMEEFADDTFDAVTFDPPYVAQGGRSTIGAKAEDFTNRYGLRVCAATPEELLEDNCAGIHQCARVTKPGGIILVKCKAYVSSGELFPAHHHVYNYATIVDELEYVDEFVHVQGTGPQPKTNKDGSERRQVHARQNSSTLYVFRKPK